MRKFLFVILYLAAPLSASAQAQELVMPGLESVPADSIIQGFLCPMHPHVTAEKGGYNCYICGMALVDGRIKMPHASHDPHYGGTFFMARDLWHHIEGAMPAPGIFRLYTYDNYSNPITTINITGRVIFQEFRDENGDEIRPPIEAPLADGPDGVSLILADRRLQLERDFYILVKFKPNQEEEDRFDFAFYAYSDPNMGIENAGADNEDKSGLVIPEDRQEILNEIDVRMEQIQRLIDRSALTEIFVPALEAKDLALALLDRSMYELDEEQLEGLTHAVRHIVRAAWLLDDYGDYGDKPKVVETFVIMEDGVSQVKTIYP